MASLENGVGALAAASGHAAQALAIFTLAQAGDHIVSSSTLYGGTATQLLYTLPRLGIEATLVDPSDPAEFPPRHPAQHQTALRRDARQPADQRLSISRKWPRSGSEFGIPLMIDNTFASPYLARPFEYGANIVVHSATKYIGGHGTSIGGVIVDGGNFQWEGNPALPQFQPAGSLLPRPGVRLAGSGRLHPEGARPDHARLRRLHLALQFLPVHPGAGNAQPAHAAPLWRTPKKLRNS